MCHALFFQKCFKGGSFDNRILLQKVTLKSHLVRRSIFAQIGWWSHLTNSSLNLSGHIWMDCKSLLYAVYVIFLTTFRLYCKFWSKSTYYAMRLNLDLSTDGFLRRVHIGEGQKLRYFLSSFTGLNFKSYLIFSYIINGNQTPKNIWLLVKDKYLT